MQHTAAVNWVSRIWFGYSVYLYLYHCVPNLQHLEDEQILCPAENCVEFIKLQEGIWMLVLIIMEGLNLDLGKTWTIEKEHQNDALSLVQYVTAAAEVQQHNCEGYGGKMTQR